MSSRTAISSHSPGSFEKPENGSMVSAAVVQRSNTLSRSQRRTGQQHCASGVVRAQRSSFERNSARSSAERGCASVSTQTLLAKFFLVTVLSAPVWPQASAAEDSKLSVTWRFTFSGKDAGLATKLDK